MQTAEEDYWTTSVTNSGPLPTDHFQPPLSWASHLRYWPFIIITAMTALGPFEYMNRTNQTKTKTLL